MGRAEAVAAAVSLAVGYLVGGIPFGLLLGRLKGVDVRAIGSGNVGATNVGRALGRRWGLVALVLDISKGFFPAFFLAPFLAAALGCVDAPFAGATMGLGAVLGHVFSPYLLLRGGKGVATTIGVFGALVHFWLALPLAGYLVVRKASGFVSAGSLALALLLPVAAFLHHRGDPGAGWSDVGFAFVAGALIVARHARNIGRLARGEEHAAAVRPVATGGDADRGEEEAR